MDKRLLSKIYGCRAKYKIEWGGGKCVGKMKNPLEEKTWHVHSAEVVQII